jgi:hypothetical protein
MLALFETLKAFKNLVFDLHARARQQTNFCILYTKNTVVKSL